MDGNGRWAQNQSQDRLYGHSYGVESVREVVKGAVDLGIKYLTIYAFSTENWGRPQSEVEGIMQLLATTIANEIKPLASKGVKMEFIGDLSILPIEIQERIKEAQSVEIKEVKLTLVIALNYSARWEITRATQLIAEKVKNGELKSEDVTQDTISKYLTTNGVPDPELMIRTSGEVRLSNFLLWQLSYSELIFTDVLWPDFNKEEFTKAINIYLNRVRRFGKI